MRSSTIEPNEQRASFPHKAEGCDEESAGPRKGQQRVWKLREAIVKASGEGLCELSSECHVPWALRSWATSNSAL